MKISFAKTGLALLGAAVSAYFGALLPPLLVLLAAMALDYATGLAKAFVTGTLSSKLGLHGIVKKLCCMAMVAVGAAVDYLVSGVLQQAGIPAERSLFFGLLVTVWLILNELISVLENLAATGIPVPAPLAALLTRLQDSAMQDLRAASEPANRVGAEQPKTTEKEEIK